MIVAPFRSLPIQSKLRLVILITCSVALTVACIGLFALQFYFFQRDYKRDLAAVAQIIAEMSSGALAAGLPESTRDVLGALKAKPHVVGAFVRVENSRMIYGQFGRLDPELIDETLPAGFQSRAGELIYVHPITDGGEKLGALYLVSDYRSESARLMNVYAGILAAVLATSFLVAMLVSWRLVRVLSDPIKNLAETAGMIASRSDYSLRANKAAEDEIGEFTEVFNHMLEQIQSRDNALRHEIAERTRAEQELQNLHQKLMETSRQAGMAEVATGVLHNVGNVLNSVNVSATVIAERLGSAKTGNLVRATQLLREHNGQLAEFLTNDPKGRVLPSYLADVSDHLARDRTTALTELESLTKNIEHIKDIVAMQQSYARVSGVLETLPVTELIDDALRMNASAFKRHGITVVLEFEPVPPMNIDKHKVLQILINLLRNAKFALEEGSAPDKRLLIAVRHRDEGFVEIAIADNGIGIPPENLTRIFSHGFTTRKHGHGFGLHSGALAAQQMGGRLTAHSEGRGYGATFTLTLPFAAEPQT